ncbi:hypothetical protein [Bacillus sinesaloumensis]|uniref:hypothetical protein n=1 Tax=Litchfieldia sinesaloumensis TaxID=1926280 RepID=UPI0009888775|nr:hypothetical protein [Bacillus sinesaloumensis]
MHWKKYAMLLPPFVLIGLLLLFYLPTGQKHYAILVALVFWAVYYAWVCIDKKRGTEGVKGINK